MSCKTVNSGCGGGGLSCAAFWNYDERQQVGHVTGTRGRSAVQEFCCFASDGGLAPIPSRDAAAEHGSRAPSSSCGAGPCCTELVGDGTVISGFRRCAFCAGTPFPRPRSPRRFFVVVSILCPTCLLEHFGSGCDGWGAPFALFPMYGYFRGVLMRPHALPAQQQPVGPRTGRIIVSALIWPAFSSLQATGGVH